MGQIVFVTDNQSTGKHFSSLFPGIISEVLVDLWVLGNVYDVGKKVVIENFDQWKDSHQASRGVEVCFLVSKSGDQRTSNCGKVSVEGCVGGVMIWEQNGVITVTVCVIADPMLIHCEPRSVMVTIRV